MKSITIYILLICFMITGNCNAQENDEQGSRFIDVKTYVQLVLENNKTLYAEKYEIEIADANLELLKPIPDPEFAISGFDNQEHQLKMGQGYNASLEWLMETGGKRKVRKELAKTGQQLALQNLNNEMRIFKAAAKTLFYETVLAEENLQVSWNSYHIIKELARMDSLRYLKGSASKMEALQSKLESEIRWNECMEKQAERDVLLQEMVTLAGLDINAKLRRPLISSPQFLLPFNLDQAIAQALEKRSDFKFSQLKHKESNQELQHTKAERATDITWSIEHTFNTEARNDIGETPQFRTTALGVQIPLKFSNFNKAALKIGAAQIAQSQILENQVKLEITAEVKNAFVRYENAHKRMQQLDDHFLQEARQILDAKKYSYQRGEDSLMEVLFVQNTYNEMQQLFNETKYNLIQSQINLEKAIQIPLF